MLRPTSKRRGRLEVTWMEVVTEDKEKLGTSDVALNRNAWQIRIHKDNPNNANCTASHHNAIILPRSVICRYEQKGSN